MPQWIWHRQVSSRSLALGSWRCCQPLLSGLNTGRRGLSLCWLSPGMVQNLCVIPWEHEGNAKTWARSSSRAHRDHTACASGPAWALHCPQPSPALHPQGLAADCFGWSQNTAMDMLVLPNRPLVHGGNQQKVGGPMCGSEITGCCVLSARPHKPCAPCEFPGSLGF